MLIVWLNPYSRHFQQSAGTSGWSGFSFTFFQNIHSAATIKQIKNVTTSGKIKINLLFKRGFAISSYTTVTSDTEKAHKV